MKKTLLLLSAACLSLTLGAQTVSTFESLSLPGSDTAYVNYSNPGQDVGFQSGSAYFRCYYDTSSFGDYWAGGFAYSNKQDSVTPGYRNQYSAMPGVGHNGSANYAVYWHGYSALAHTIQLRDSAVGKPVRGFFATNSTYAYRSMKNGDNFAKKFGGPTGTDPDYFRLVIYGYLNGARKADSVVFYLADFRSPVSSRDYILHTWQYVNTAPLGPIDSMQFAFESSDTGQFGINTPEYFCLDDFYTATSTDVPSVAASAPVKIYPNPARDLLYIDADPSRIQRVRIVDAAGRILRTEAYQGAGTPVSVADLAPGTYLLQLTGEHAEAVTRFIKH